MIYVRAMHDAAVCRGLSEKEERGGVWGGGGGGGDVIGRMVAKRAACT